VQGRPVWELLQFLINATLFVLVGLQLPVAASALKDNSSWALAGYAAAIWATVMGIRLLWGFIMPLLIRALDRRPAQRERRSQWRARVIIAWSGMRGAVSLAAALAIPLHTDAGKPFPERDLIIFLAFSVILATLVIQGLTLPLLLERLGVHDDGAEEREEVEARLYAAEAGIARLEELAEEEWTREDTVDRARRLFEYRQRRFGAQRDGDGESDGIEDRSVAYQRLQRELLTAQREAVVAMRNEGHISNEVMTRIERELDLEDSRLEI
jgi:NhaP-type Na+/H+ or K+/H+ antiporter